MRGDLLKQSPISATLAIIAVVLIGGVSGLLSLIICSLMVGIVGLDSAEKHGISEVLSSRLGGFVVLVYLLMNTLFLVFLAGYSLSLIELTVLAGAVGFFVIGVVEDFTAKTGVFKRFVLMTILTLILVGFNTDLRLDEVGIVWVDWIINYTAVMPLLFTSVCMIFLPNAFNTADGANGLVGGIGFVSLATLGILVPNSLGVLQVSAAVGCLIFLIFNLRTGRFFLGDGGAYAIGALIGCSLIHVAKTSDVSTWFLVSLIFYPSADLIWSMLRRRAANRPIAEPDEHHLHNLLYRLLRDITGAPKAANNATGLGIVTIFCLFPVFFALIGVLPVYASGWEYVVFTLWLLYTFAWFTLSRKYRQHSINVG